MTSVATKTPKNKQRETKMVTSACTRLFKTHYKIFRAASQMQKQSHEVAIACCNPEKEFMIGNTEPAIFMLSSQKCPHSFSPLFHEQPCNNKDP